MSENLAHLKRQLASAEERVNCPIWTPGERSLEGHGPDALGIYAPPDNFYDSPRAGGVFRFDGKADFEFSVSDDTRIKISRWIYDKNQLGEVGYLTNDEIERIEKQGRLRIDQRMNRLLQCFATLPDEVSQGLGISGSVTPISRNALWTVQAATECSLGSHFETGVTAELKWLIAAAMKSGWLEQHELHAENRRLTPEGVRRLEELETKAVNSEQAFVAMWFDESVKAVCEEGIESAIRDSGYKPLRIDKQEHIGKIDDQIIAEIRRSRFVVCDFTCELIECDGEQKAFPRGGVYYEAGFAQGLGIPVIWMCRADHIEHVHFDTRQFNHITWSTPEELREKLRNRIGAVIGDGPLKGRQMEKN